MCQPSVFCNSAIKQRYFLSNLFSHTESFFKLIFTQKILKTYFHTESISNLLSQRRFFKLTFTQKLFQTYFHIEGFSNLLSHRNFFKLTFTQKVFQTCFHTESLSNLLSQRRFFKLTSTQKVVILLFLLATSQLRKTEKNRR